MSTNQPTAGRAGAAACPKCGASVPGGAKFCAKCGAPLSAPPALARAVQSPPGMSAPAVARVESGVLPAGEVIADADGKDLYIVIEQVDLGARKSAGDPVTYRAEAAGGGARALLHEVVAPAELAGLARLAAAGELPGVARVGPLFRPRLFGADRLYVAEAEPLKAISFKQWVDSGIDRVSEDAQQLANGLAQLHARAGVAFNLDASQQRRDDHITFLATGGAQWSNLRDLAPLQSNPEAAYADARALAAWLSQSMPHIKNDLEAIAAGKGRIGAVELLRLLSNAVPRPQTQPPPGAAGDARATHKLAGQAREKPLQVDLGHATDTGIVRTGNEDSYIATVLTLSNDNQKRSVTLLAVADGMGGEAAGEVASRLTIESLLQSSAEAASEGFQPVEWVQKAARRANELVVAEAKRRGNQMGATLVFALICDDVAYLGNVGDSRIYRWNPHRDSGQMTRLVKDHSLVQRFVDLGQLSDEGRYTHPDRNMVLRSIGDARNGFSDQNSPLALQPGDWLLLCSDGLWEMARDPALRDILARAPNAQAACDHMVAEANKNGGEDNITVVIARFQ